MKKPPVIKYEKTYPEFYDLQPIKSNIPQWYKDVPKWIEGQTIWNQSGLKQCVPFLDAFMTGYMIPLPVDVYVETKEDNLKYFSWANSEYTIIHHRVNNDHFPPILPGFSEMRVVWIIPMSIEIPKGYSALFTHPLNRFDLPFMTLSGVVDEFKMYNGGIPFLIKEDFEGLIPAGTPIAQIIPFKTESWKSAVKDGLNKEAEVIKKRSRNSLTSLYKSHFWKRKTYE